MQHRLQLAPPQGLRDDAVHSAQLPWRPCKHGGKYENLYAMICRSGVLEPKGVMYPRWSPLTSTVQGVLRVYDCISAYAVESYTLTLWCGLGQRIRVWVKYETAEFTHSGNMPETALKCASKFFGQQILSTSDDTACEPLHRSSRGPTRIASGVKGLRLMPQIR